MKAYTYIEKGHFALLEKPEPEILSLKLLRMIKIA